MELTTLFLLGTYHGINPGMGWLFAVGLGLQEGRGQAVWRALLPIALGHTLAIGLVVSLAALIEVVIPTEILSALVAVTLVALGVYKLVRHRHPRLGGMRVGFKDLVAWSFMMASAHGAGLMVLPFLGGEASGGQHHGHMAGAMSPESGLFAVAIHTVGYLIIMGAAAFVFYKKLGLALLRTAWINLDLIWAVALIATGVLTWIRRWQMANGKWQMGNVTVSVRRGPARQQRRRVVTSSRDSVTRTPRRPGQRGNDAERLFFFFSFSGRSIFARTS